jgi:DNA-binding transcriptional ArsR family regulator
MKGKADLASLKAHYFKTTNRIFEVGLDATTVAVYCFMCSRSEEFNPSVSVIAEYLQLHRQTVMRSLRILRQRGIIELLVQGHGNRAATYRLIPPHEWVNNA